MSYEHHQMAHLATATMLHEIRSRAASWSVPCRLSEKTTFWQGFADWPRPDQAFEDASTEATLAIEFKPPGRDRGEYVRGLGQAVTYLENFEFSALVVPKRANDGYEIGSYLANLLGQRVRPQLPLAILEYENDPSQLVARLNLCARIDQAPGIPRRDRRQVFWAYWRDLSQFELYELLRLMGRRNEHFDIAFKRFWEKFRAKGKALNWEGKPRKPTRSAAYFRSERINSKLSLRHLALIGSDNRLTQDGYAFLAHGNIYGPSSMSFGLKLGRQILTRGRHIELIFWVEEAQRGMARRRKRHPQAFIGTLDKQLEDAGVIARAPVGRAKVTFLRDEPKLWNKLGLVMKRGKQSYFFPGEGFRFNWRACIDMLNYT